MKKQTKIPPPAHKWVFKHMLIHQLKN